ncbi:hypothetical protein FS815_28515, partial [Agrobacterium vitis]|nr:hypothetical protein [Allorhizobium ampelinum]
MNASDLVPCLHGCFSQFAMMGGWNVVAGNVKEVGNRIVDGNEPLAVIKKRMQDWSPEMVSDPIQESLLKLIADKKKAKKPSKAKAS